MKNERSIFRWLSLRNFKSFHRTPKHILTNIVVLTEKGNNIESESSNVRTRAGAICTLSLFGRLAN